MILIQLFGCALRQSAKVKCKSEGALRLSAKVKCKSEVYMRGRLIHSLSTGAQRRL
jgi:hypothetical protein